MIIDLTIVPRQLLSRLDLLRTQAFHIHDVAKIVIIYGNENLMFAIFQIVLASLESLKNS